MFFLKFVAPEKNAFVAELLRDLSVQTQQASGSFSIACSIAVYCFIFLYTLKHYRDLCQKFMAKRKEDLTQERK